jgi:predicted O-methyltransferase YrrM
LGKAIVNQQTLTKIAEQAALTSPMIAHYPDPTNDKVTFPPSPYYRFLKLLAQKMDSKLSVELGVCGGGGSLHLAMTSQTAVGIDVVEDHKDNTDWIKNCYPNWYFMIGDSVHLASIVHDQFGLIDVLFIDTTHTHRQTMAEYEAYQPYLSDRAVICLDDLFRPGMDLAWADMPETKERFDFLHPSASPTDGGFGVIWKE